MAFGLAVYVSRCWLPVTAQDSLPGAGQALLDGLSTRRVPAKGFQLTSCSLSSFSKLLGTMHQYCPDCQAGDRQKRSHKMLSDIHLRNHWRFAPPGAKRLGGAKLAAKPPAAKSPDAPKPPPNFKKPPPDLRLFLPKWQSGRRRWPASRRVRGASGSVIGGLHTELNVLQCLALLLCRSRNATACANAPVLHPPYDLGKRRCPSARQAGPNRRPPRLPVPARSPASPATCPAGNGRGR